MDVRDEEGDQVGAAAEQDQMILFIARASRDSTGPRPDGIRVRQ